MGDKTPFNYCEILLKLSNKHSFCKFNFVNSLKLTDIYLCLYQFNNVWINIQSYNAYFIWLNTPPFKIVWYILLDFANRCIRRIEIYLGTWHFQITIKMYFTNLRSLIILNTHCFVKAKYLKTKCCVQSLSLVKKNLRKKKLCNNNF